MKKYFLNNRKNRKNRLYDLIIFEYYVKKYNIEINNQTYYLNKHHQGQTKRQHLPKPLIFIHVIFYLLNINNKYSLAFSSLSIYNRIYSSF